MKQRAYFWKGFFLAFLATTVLTANAEQKKQVGEWDVHYMVVGTTFLTPEIAKKNGIVRSRFNALVNISVLNTESKIAQSVALSGTARNLLGTTKALKFKQVKEGDAIYYLAVLNFRDREKYRFNIDIQLGNERQTLAFQQELFVD